MKTYLVLVIAVLSFVPLVSQQTAPRAGTVQGLEFRVDGFRTASELKLFPEDRNSPTVEAKDGMTLGIVTLSVAPSDNATLLKAADFALSDASGATYDLVFTNLFNTCEGRRKQTCDMPFNVPKDATITSLIVGSLTLSLVGLPR